MLTTMGIGKGGQGGLGPNLPSLSNALDFEISTKKVDFLIYSGKKQI